MFQHHHESRKLSIKIKDHPKNGLKLTQRRANGELVVEKAVMSAKIEPGSQADDDRKIQKKIGITSAAKFGDLDSG